MNFISVLQINLFISVVVLYLDMGAAAQAATKIKTSSAASTINTASTTPVTSPVTVSSSSVSTNGVFTVMNSSEAVSPTESDVVQLPLEPGLPEDTYAVKTVDKTCALITLDAAFAVNYSRRNEATLQHNCHMPDEVKVDGSCEDDEKKARYISVAWLSYKLSFTVKKSSDGQRWYVTSIRFSYSPAEVFKNKTLDTFCQLETSSDEYFLETPMNSSFACSDPRTVAFFSERGLLAAHMVTQTIQLQVYNIPKDNRFGPEFPCGPKLDKAVPAPTPSQDDIYRSDTVPIAVGSCFAVITVLVIAGYATYRSLTVKKMDYATMEE